MKLINEGNFSAYEKKLYNSKNILKRFRELGLNLIDRDNNYFKY